MARLRSHTYDLEILGLAMEGLPTGNDSDEALARSFGYGADDLVVKPFQSK